MTARPAPQDRSAYRSFRSVSTRWSDNDVYGHMNNVVHYSLFDTAVNAFLIENGVLDPHSGSHAFFVVETSCRYFSEIAYPDTVTIGLRVSALGKSSVRYEIGLFRNEEKLAAAEGVFIHVHVDRATRRPAPLSEPARHVLQTLQASAES